MIEDGTKFTLYVPAKGAPSTRHIKQGSAMVGQPMLGDNAIIDLYYEGGIYQANARFADFIDSAAGRMAMRYPTAARMAAPTQDLVTVGTVTYSARLRCWTVSKYENEAALKEWIEDVPPVGGTREQRQRAAGLLWPTLSPVKLMQLEARSNAGEDTVDVVLQIA